jgi:hypothetical protein
MSGHRDPRPQEARVLTHQGWRPGCQRRQDRAAGYEEPVGSQAAAFEAGSRAQRNAEKRKPDEPLFPIVDARKTLAWINAKAGTSVRGHGLRATFASIAEELVSGAVLKKMMNHAAGADVTLGHYVGKSEAQLRAGWQVVADFIEASAAPAHTGSTRLQLGPPSRSRPWRRAAVRSTAAVVEPDLVTRDS